MQSIEVYHRIKDEKNYKEIKRHRNVLSTHLVNNSTKDNYKFLSG